MPVNKEQSDKQLYFEAIAKEAPVQAAHMVNKWTNNERRLFCDSIMTTYFQSTGMMEIFDKSKADKDKRRFCAHVIQLVDKALDEVMRSIGRRDGKNK